jgi:hypothetical protein
LFLKKGRETGFLDGIKKLNYKIFEYIKNDIIREQKNKLFIELKIIPFGNPVWK